VALTSSTSLAACKSPEETFSHVVALLFELEKELEKKFLLCVHVK
jgi:hypothetical protein